VDPVTTKEALMTENGRNNPNIQDGGNAIRYMAYQGYTMDNVQEVCRFNRL
jgi:hypothetical protein